MTRNLNQKANSAIDTVLNMEGVRGKFKQICGGAQTEFRERFTHLLGQEPTSEVALRVLQNLDNKHCEEEAVVHTSREYGQRNGSEVSVLMHTKRR